MVSGAFDSLSHMMETYFSEPDEQNVSDEISEALMRSVIKTSGRQCVIRKTIQCGAIFSGVLRCLRTA